MAILLCLDDIIEDRGATVTELANAVGISRINMSNLKMGKVNQATSSNSFVQKELPTVQTV